jgi:hypothetical protein
MQVGKILLQLENFMEIAIRNISNSKGLVLSKPFLALLGLDCPSTAIIEVENGSIVLRKPVQTVRAGWAGLRWLRLCQQKGGSDLLM